MANTYTNPIQPEEVTMALEHILYAPYGTAYVPAGKIDVSTPPAGFAHLGGVADDSPAISVTKDFFRLTGGIPSVLQYQAVTALAGEFSLTLNTNSALAAYLALGGIAPWHTPATAGGGEPVGYYSVVTSSANSRLQTCLSSVGALAVGDMLVTGTTVGNAINTSLNYAWVASVNATDDAVALSGEGWKVMPTDDDSVFKVKFSRYALGTSQAPRLHLIGVADFLNGGQIIHDMPLVQPKGQWTESLRAGGIIQVACSFDLFGYTMTSPHSTAGEVVVGERIIIPGIRIQ